MRILPVVLAIAVVGLGVASGSAVADTPPPPPAATSQADYSLWSESGQIQAGAGPATVQADKSVDGVAGSADADYPGYNDFPGVRGGVTGCPDGCGFQAADAGGSVNVAAGRLQADAFTSLKVVNAPNADFGADSQIESGARFADTITLSEPATVTLTGSIAGTLSATNGDDYWLSDPRARVHIDLSFGCLGPSCLRNEGGPEQYGGLSHEDSADAVTTCSDPDPDTDCNGAEAAPFPEPPAPQPTPFSIPVTLPAGTSSFTGDLSTTVSALIDGEGGISLATQAGADFSGPHQGVTFSILVPDGVCATSGSGRLPIVGGSTCAPSDTTPPVLSLPPRLDVDATGPDGAVVDYTATATDAVDPAPELKCLPASGSLMPIGLTQVRCTATDAAGNEATGGFAVTVHGAADQLAALRERIASYDLPRGITRSLQAKLANASAAERRASTPASCGQLEAFRHEIAARAGRILDAARAAPLDAAAQRIEDVLAC